MQNAEKLFSESDLLDVETSIVKAEEETSVEIVCAVATESGRYDRGECHFGIVVALLALVLFNLLRSWFEKDSGGFFDSGLPFYWQLAIVVIGYVTGMIAASYDTRLRMLLGTQEEIEEEVAKGARLVFLEQVLSSERLGGAVLLYVSLAECRVAVMVDDRVKSAMQEDCSKMVVDVQQRVTRLIQSEGVAKSLSAGVSLVADRVKAAIPYREDDANELPNHVVLIHPRP